LSEFVSVQYQQYLWAGATNFGMCVTTNKTMCQYRRRGAKVVRGVDRSKLVGRAFRSQLGNPVYLNAAVIYIFLVASRDPSPRSSPVSPVFTNSNYFKCLSFPSCPSPEISAFPMVASFSPACQILLIASVTPTSLVSNS